LRQELLLVAVPKALNGAVSLGLSLALAQMLGPDDFGLVGFCLTYLMLMDVLLGAAIDLSVGGRITRVPLGLGLHPLEVAGLFWKTAIGLSAFLLLILAGQSIGQRLFLRVHAGTTLQLWALAATMMLLFRSLQLYLQARSLFRWHGLTDLSHTFLRVVLVALLAWSGRISANSIMSAYAAAGGLVLFVAGFHLRRRLDFRRAPLTLQSLWGVARASAPTILTFGLSAIVSRMDMALLAIRTGPEDLGLYSAALTIAMIPEIAASYAAPALLPRIQPACQTGGMERLFWQVNKPVFALCALGLALAMSVSPGLVRILLGSSYERSAEILPVLLLGTIAISSIFPITLNFLLLRDQRAAIAPDLWMMPIMAAAYWFLLPPFGVKAAAWLMAASRVVKATSLQYRAAQLAYRVRPVLPDPSVPT
jgi:O-antigen/teichoic acid export membrane protein